MNINSSHDGKRLCVSKADGSIDVFQDGKLATTLTGHKGPVFDSVFIHPDLGSAIVSIGQDGRLIVWVEEDPNHFRNAHSMVAPSSLLALSIAPKELGFRIAAACANGSVFFTTYNHGKLSHSSFHAHDGGCTSVTWCPHVPTTDSTRALLATGGCDGNVKVWACTGSSGVSSAEDGAEEYSKPLICIKAHDWVSCVAWAPGITETPIRIASCGREGKVFVHKAGDVAGKWESLTIVESSDDVKPCWSVSWNMIGTVLAVGSGDSQISLYHESGEGVWEEAKVEEREVTAAEE
ncbi:Sec13/Seh1 family like protein [Aduncisulcus paluster]|uniref:Sec13/Seh1 family like protein n=1 Tax=Aduncisulcus paluster TaxID=2918883 RepID=A0ABQ5K0U5_9EUKA|nr:Sec13/Seh1 family like protein [Aduncisulcus paluster]|eukprot:gnl/Carplike_NY0171/1210_a1630_1571.p1 GENE.gnl/Carplike_NY0171/1210_a1630_1571~~gnl/Carplike_NY0171/1210_a1630_1571.p1  ORF type:complete len:293 (-),score=51.97 gnl/Carplike_NY0171/1210_a1630_1571:32-910(-)